MWRRHLPGLLRERKSRCCRMRAGRRESSTWPAGRLSRMLLLATSTRYGWLASPASALRAGGRRAARRTLMSEATARAGLLNPDMMERDLLILVDGDDRVTGAMSKREAHTFGDETPRGWLHRAFSCFLFDARGRMLLTKRADSKITFPGVWTNACCSHPLHGRVPDEVDTAPVADDAFAMPGHQARRAAQAGARARHRPGAGAARRLPLPTRFHYWAADARPPWRALLVGRARGRPRALRAGRRRRGAERRRGERRALPPPPTSCARC